MKDATNQSLDAPFLFPLFEHMQSEHGLTLVESELDEIRHVCRRLDSLAAASPNVADEQRRGNGSNHE